MYQLPKRKKPERRAFFDRGRAGTASGVMAHDDLPWLSKFCLPGLSSKLYEKYLTEPLVIDGFAMRPSGHNHASAIRAAAPLRKALYTPEERRRRDESRWTLVQGILAPLQFAVFVVSAGLVVRYLATGDGLMAATVSIVVKTFVLYAIMITGSLWEHDVYGRYLFAPAFFWEDVVSMLVLALHSAYLAALATGALEPREQMFLALAAYVAYLVNATQFLLKLRAARLEAKAADIVGFPR